MKKKILALVLMMFFVSTVVYAQDKTNISVGFVNVQKVIALSDVAKEARKKLDSFREEKTVEMDAHRLDLEGAGKMLDKERNTNSFDMAKVAKLTEEFQLAKKSFDRLVEDINEALMRREKHFVGQVMAKASSVIKDIAQEKGFTIVLWNAKEIAYVSLEADITDEVIKRLNTPASAK